MTGTGYIKDFEEQVELRTQHGAGYMEDTCRLGKIMEPGAVRHCHLSKGHSEQYHETIFRRSIVRWTEEEEGK
jgi:hypothetical protein